MSRKLLLWFLVLVPAVGAQQLIPYEREGKWGFINPQGQVVIKPQFDEVESFSEKLARVSVGLDQGFIDEHGSVVIKPQFRCAFGFSEGLAPVARDCGGKWEYIDRDGKTVIPAKFSWAGQFSEGRAEVLLVADPNVPNILKSGYIDKSGNVVIDPKYGWSEPFSNGLALIADNKPDSNEYFNPKAFIDRNGKQATKFFQNAETFSEGLAGVEINSLWGFINRDGVVVIKPEYDFILREFENGFAAVNCRNDRVAFIDKKGRKITPCRFLEAWPFSEGLAGVQSQNKKFGFINTKGLFVVAPRFSYVDSFLHGLAKVRIVRSGWIYEGYINRHGRYVITPEKKRKVGDD